MSLSPLAERIYQTLLRQLRLPNPLISYGDLVRAVGPLPSPDTELKANDPRLFEALGEILRACQSSKPPMPALTSIVVRRSADGSLGTPGAGYFAVGFPQVRDETKRVEMWREEVRRVVAFSYPAKLTSPAFSRPTERRERPRWLREPTVIAALIGLAGTLFTVIVTAWVSTRHREPAQPPPAERSVKEIIPSETEKPAQLPQANRALTKITPQQIDKPSQPPKTEPPAEKNAPKVLTLDGILEVLERHHQRATFGAVAAILDREPTSLFAGYVRTPKTAWVVNKTTRLPTGFETRDYPLGLREKEHVIATHEELGVWLREHH
jgi:hypothetical protein